MNYQFKYPLNLKKEKEGGYVVTFPDLPEAITQGNNIEDALIEARDCLEEAIANRIEMKLAIPKPSKPKKNQKLAILHATIAAKTALYVAMKEAKLNNISLAKRLHCDEKEVRRLIDPHYASKFPRIEQALENLGMRLEIAVHSN